MEDLINPECSDLNPVYIIFKDETFCCVTGIWFVERECNNFNIKDKIIKLNEIIDNIINQLKHIAYDNKESLIENLKIKKINLENLLDKYKNLENNYNERYSNFAKKKI